MNNHTLISLRVEPGLCLLLVLPCDFLNLKKDLRRDPLGAWLVAEHVASFIAVRNDLCHFRDHGPVDDLLQGQASVADRVELQLEVGTLGAVPVGPCVGTRRPRTPTSTAGRCVPSTLGHRPIIMPFAADHARGL